LGGSAVTRPVRVLRVVGECGIYVYFRGGERTREGKPNPEKLSRKSNTVKRRRRGILSDELLANYRDRLFEPQLLLIMVRELGGNV